MNPEPFDLNKIKRYPLSERTNKVSVDDFATLPEKGDLSEFFRILPGILAGKEIKNLLRAILEAKENHQPVALAMGGHVVKVGVTPLIIDLMKRGFINRLVMHGATAIHDYEISLIGATSEWVENNLPEGTFGMARETAQGLARAAKKGREEGIGLGRALGDLILLEENLHQKHSLLAMARQLDIPCTVHVGIGTDIVHMHPECSGEDLGAASHLDFRILCSLLKDMEQGVWINLGSAVLLPEVFLKALSVAINTGSNFENLTTANLDMMRHYRPSVNVLGRPPGRSISLTGHHELLIPLLYMGLVYGGEFFS